jgi:hypothetical protein
MDNHISYALLTAACVILMVSVVCETSWRMVNAGIRTFALSQNLNVVKVPKFEEMTPTAIELYTVKCQQQIRHCTSHCMLALIWYQNSPSHVFGLRYIPKWTCHKMHLDGQR